VSNYYTKALHQRIAIRKVMQCPISSVVPKTSKSLRFMMVELNRLMNFFFSISAYLLFHPTLATRKHMGASVETGMNP
jgi:NADH:ubiquinone oxidoreductase subunit D